MKAALFEARVNFFTSRRLGGAEASEASPLNSGAASPARLSLNPHTFRLRQIGKLDKVLGVYRCLSLGSKVLGYVLLALVTENRDDALKLGI
ncbi:hypothetical protein BH20ACT11_BH20ACT11_09820 [soil metagenome]